MARKRKIPVRKHHGVRDPLKQKALLEEKLKNVINNPPSKDDQSISKKFSQFMNLLNEGQKKNENKTRVNQKIKEIRSKGDETGAIKQLPNESEIKYLRRVNRITKQTLREAEYEVKYGVSVVRNHDTGEMSLKKRPLNEIDEILKLKKQRGRSKKGISQVEKTMDKKTAKQLIKQAIKEEKEETKKLNIEEFQKDIIKFGEVVHAPPCITVFPRKAARNESVPRPGKKTNLLLRKIFNKIESKHQKGSDNANKTSNKFTSSGLKGKRKHLPLATRAMLDTEQAKIIDLYKNMKKKEKK